MRREKKARLPLTCITSAPAVALIVVDVVVVVVAVAFVPHPRGF